MWRPASGSRQPRASSPKLLAQRSQSMNRTCSSRRLMRSDLHPVSAALAHAEDAVTVGTAERDHARRDAERPAAELFGRDFPFAGLGEAGSRRCSAKTLAPIGLARFDLLWHSRRARQRARGKTARGTPADFHS